jgi:hypothetical protein
MYRRFSTHSLHAPVILRHRFSPMHSPKIPALVIIDLLSHQGPHDNLFALVEDSLSNKLVDPANLFIFSDLQPYKSALSTACLVASAAASIPAPDPLVLLTALLGGLGTYTRRGKKDFPFLAHSECQQLD